MAKPLLDGARLLGITHARPKKQYVEVAIGLRSDWHSKFSLGHPALLGLERGKCTLRFINTAMRYDPGSFAAGRETPRAEAHSIEAASFHLDMTRKLFADILATDGKTLFDLSTRAMIVQSGEFTNGNRSVLANTVEALARYLHVVVVASSETPARHRRMVTLLFDRTGARRSAQPGLFAAISRWFGWSGTEYSQAKYAPDCEFRPLSERFEAPDIRDPCLVDDEERLDAIWIALTGENDPRKHLKADSSYHEQIEAEQQYQEILLPRAHLLRDDVARLSKTSPERLVSSAKNLATRINEDRVRLFS